MAFYVSSYTPQTQVMGITDTDDGVEEFRTLKEFKREVLPLVKRGVIQVDGVTVSSAGFSVKAVKSPGNAAQNLGVEGDKSVSVQDYFKQCFYPTITSLIQPLFPGETVTVGRDFEDNSNREVVLIGSDSLGACGIKLLVQDNIRRHGKIFIDVKAGVFSTYNKLVKYAAGNETLFSTTISKVQLDSMHKVGSKQCDGWNIVPNSYNAGCVYVADSTNWFDYYNPTDFQPYVEQLCSGVVAGLQANIGKMMDWFKLIKSGAVYYDSSPDGPSRASSLWGSSKRVSNKDAIALCNKYDGKIAVCTRKSYEYNDGGNPERFPTHIKVQLKRVCQSASDCITLLKHDGYRVAGYAIVDDLLVLSIMSAD